MYRWFLSFLINHWPPYLGTGIRVAHIAEDYRSLTVEMPLRFYNRNYVGTHFGGSLYAMVDPFYMLMLLKTLGKDYIVWDQSACIDFVNPGRGKVRACFSLDDEMIEEIKRKTADGGKFLPTYPVDVVDEEGTVVARATKTLYIRRKKRAA